jgi:hypothetical protein
MRSSTTQPPAEERHAFSARAWLYFAVIVIGLGLLTVLPLRQVAPTVQPVPEVDVPVRVSITLDGTERHFERQVTEPLTVLAALGEVAVSNQIPLRYVQEGNAVIISAIGTQSTRHEGKTWVTRVNGTPLASDALKTRLVTGGDHVSVQLE